MIQQQIHPETFQIHVTNSALAEIKCWTTLKVGLETSLDFVVLDNFIMNLVHFN